MTVSSRPEVNEVNEITEVQVKIEARRPVRRRKPRGIFSAFAVCYVWFCRFEHPVWFGLCKVIDQSVYSLIVCWLKVRLQYPSFL